MTISCNTSLLNSGKTTYAMANTALAHDIWMSETDFEWAKAEFIKHGVLWMSDADDHLIHWTMVNRVATRQYTYEDEEVQTVTTFKYDEVGVRFHRDRTVSFDY